MLPSAFTLYHMYDKVIKKYKMYEGKHLQWVHWYNITDIHNHSRSRFVVTSASSFCGD